MDKDALRLELNQLLARRLVLNEELNLLRPRIAELHKQINRKGTRAEIKAAAYARRKEIAEKIMSGMSSVEVAAEYKLSVQRVNQLRAAYNRILKMQNNK